MIEPKAYLIEWEVDGARRVRVQLDTRLEGWLEQRAPKLTPLYARDGLEAFLDAARQEGAQKWINIAAAMGNREARALATEGFEAA